MANRLEGRLRGMQMGMELRKFKDQAERAKREREFEDTLKEMWGPTGFAYWKATGGKKLPPGVGQQKQGGAGSVTYRTPEMEYGKSRKRGLFARGGAGLTQPTTRVREKIVTRPRDSIFPAGAEPSDYASIAARAIYESGLDIGDVNPSLLRLGRIVNPYPWGVAHLAPEDRAMAADIATGRRARVTGPTDMDKLIGMLNLDPGAMSIGQYSFLTGVKGLQYDQSTGAWVGDEAIEQAQDFYKLAGTADNLGDDMSAIRYQLQAYFVLRNARPQPHIDENPTFEAFADALDFVDKGDKFGKYGGWRGAMEWLNDNRDMLIDDGVNVDALQTFIEAQIE